MSSSCHISEKYLDFGHHFQGLVSFSVGDSHLGLGELLLHALSGQWLCRETKGAGFGWDFEEELHRYSFPQGRCCMAHSHESALSAVPGTGMSHVTPRIAASGTGGWHKQQILGQVP